MLVSTSHLKFINKDRIYIACVMQIFAIIVVSIFSWFISSKLDGLFTVICFVMYVYKIISLLTLMKDIYTGINDKVDSVIWNTGIYLVPFVLFFLCVIYTKIFDKVDIFLFLFVMFVMFW